MPQPDKKPIPVIIVCRLKAKTVDGIKDLAVRTSQCAQYATQIGATHIITIPITGGPGEAFSKIVSCIEKGQFAAIILSHPTDIADNQQDYDTQTGNLKDFYGIKTITLPKSPKR